MIQTKLDKMLHKETSKAVKKLLSEIPNVYIDNKLDDRLQAVDLNQKQLALMTGLREGSISDFVNGKKINISKYQLVALMIALRITDIKEIIDVVFPDEIVEKFAEERKEWIRLGAEGMPKELETLYIKNLR